MNDPRHWVEIFIFIIAVFLIWIAFTNFAGLKRFLIGRRMRTAELLGQHTKLVWFIALPILAADLYSSVSYGPEAGMIELTRFGEEGKWLIIPITIATITLLAILISSYIMGILAYPSGGGAYAIAKDNFKAKWVSLVASSSLLVDYILTVAVSVSAALEAVSSAYPAVEPFRTQLGITIVFLLLIMNLRGVAESAKIFAWPTIGFMLCMLLLIFTGVFDILQHGFVQESTPPFGTLPEGLGILLILKSFSSACSALTGIETISNAVPVFRDPQQRGAIKAYITLGAITGFTLIGFAYLLYIKGISPSPGNTMLSQLAEMYVGHGILYQIIIWFTFIVLILAANSTFTGFAQLSAIVAADGFLPRVLTNRGDRLAYSNGIIALAAAASVLILAFHSETHALIPLYAIGVFLSFTIAQFGLVRRWFRVKGSRWQIKLAVNIIGFIVTSIVTVIVAVTKFTGGAWLVLVVLPLIILLSLAIRRHYNFVAQDLRIDIDKEFPEMREVTTIVLVSGVHRVVNNTMSFAKSLGGNMIAVYVGFDDESIVKMEEKWEKWGSPCRLVVLRSKYRSVLEPLNRFMKVVEEKKGEGHIHLIIPQFIPKKWWHNLLHNQTALQLRLWFLRHKNVVITTVPYLLKK
ncbi:APC family permease [Neobacillus drentensis]|uniref:APC family permease n=1 Tax=Neobacillus drentensis TaxID=220684 RepID=UPI003001B875